VIYENVNEVIAQ